EATRAGTEGFRPALGANLPSYRPGGAFGNQEVGQQIVPRLGESAAGIPAAAASPITAPIRAQPSIQRELGKSLAGKIPSSEVSNVKRAVTAGRNEGLGTNAAIQSATAPRSPFGSTLKKASPTYAAAPPFKQKQIANAAESG